MAYDGDKVDDDDKASAFAALTSWAEANNVPPIVFELVNIMYSWHKGRIMASFFLKGAGRIASTNCQFYIKPDREWEVDPPHDFLANWNTALKYQDTLQKLSLSRPLDW